MKHFFQVILLISYLIFFACNPENNEIPINQPKINFDSLSINLSVEDSVILSINGSTDTTKNKDFNWKSLEPNIVSVNNCGIAKGINPGNARIVVSSRTNQTQSDTCNVYVLVVGTETNPYKIRTINDLKRMRDRINNQNEKYATKYFQLNNDLDLSNEPEWYPIGKSEKTTFAGQFDGNSKIIRGLKLSNSSDIIHSGLFGCVNNGKILNLGVLSNTIDSTRKYVGGIVGFFQNGSIENCFHEGNLGGTYVVGGLVGLAYKTTINNSYSIGEINCNSTDFIHAGGIVGLVMESTIKGCYTKGKVISNFYSGGIAGESSYSVNIESCFSETEVIANAYAGGIVGSARDINIFNNCYHIGNVTAKNGVAGGITACNGRLYNCYSTGNITSNASAGGISGVGSEIYNCYSTGRIYTKSLYTIGDAYCYSGGIAGNAYLISNCYSNSVVITQSTKNAFTGGIAGKCPMVNNCISINDSIIAISQSNNYFAGNIVGIYKENEYDTYQFSSNYAKTTNKIFTGNSINNKNAVSNYSDYNRFGSPLTTDILSLLNNYVNQNSVINSIKLRSWVVSTGNNNGLPIFN